MEPCVQISIPYIPTISTGMHADPSSAVYPSICHVCNMLVSIVSNTLFDHMRANRHVFSFGIYACVHINIII